MDRAWAPSPVVTKVTRAFSESTNTASTYSLSCSTTSCERMRQSRLDDFSLSSSITSTHSIVFHSRDSSRCDYGSRSRGPCEDLSILVNSTLPSKSFPTTLSTLIKAAIPDIESEDELDQAREELTTKQPGLAAPAAFPSEISASSPSRSPESSSKAEGARTSDQQLMAGSLRCAVRKGSPVEGPSFNPAILQTKIPPTKSSQAAAAETETKSATRRRHPRARRRSSLGYFESPVSAQACIVFVDLEGYSKSSDDHQRQITYDFMFTVRKLLTFAYGGRLPNRRNVDNYVILPTGDGASVCVMRAPFESGTNVTVADSFDCGNNTVNYAYDNMKYLRTIEETALWIGSSLLLWAKQCDIGLRVGLNSGELNIVEDPYGDPNVCGDAINMAARIMDTALPGQILASAETVVPKLNALMEMDKFHSGRAFEEGCEMNCPGMKYAISSDPSEVIVKHGVTTYVQSITCTLCPLPKEAVENHVPVLVDSVGENSLAHLLEHPSPQPELSSVVRQKSESMARRTPEPEGHPSQHETCFLQPRSSLPSRSGVMEQVENDPQNRIQFQHKPLEVGCHSTPVTKWYMKIKPTEMKSDHGQIKAKVLPEELIRRHQSIAFIGIMHDSLEKTFSRVMEENPSLTWDRVYILFPNDECMKACARNYPEPISQITRKNFICQQTLLKLLKDKVRDLRVLQYDQLMHCGSYWDWNDPGGFIHVSPVTWGVNPKTCPAMNYYWNSKQPSAEFKIFREGLECLMKIANPFEMVTEEDGERAAEQESAVS